MVGVIGKIKMAREPRILFTLINLFNGKFSKCEVTLIRLSSFIMSFLASSIYTVPILFPGPRDPECNINHKRSSSSRQAYKVVEIIKGVNELFEFTGYHRTFSPVSSTEKYMEVRGKFLYYHHLLKECQAMISKKKTRSINLLFSLPQTGDLET